MFLHAEPAANDLSAITQASDVLQPQKVAVVYPRAFDVTFAQLVAHARRMINL